MDKLLIAAGIGIVAGTIDVVPMIIMKLEKRANFSAFIHYFVLGLVIPFVDWGIPAWLTGMIVATLVAIPTMIIVYPTDHKSIVPMIIFALVLGAGIGLAGDAFII
ncbi:MAG: hypothetical protein JW801_16405 [Bacteroidales bacterium]|nr:hypothetical protein [Bacteroidales bacterium]